VFISEHAPPASAHSCLIQLVYGMYATP
jgi:hypothetical protein